jgi:chromosome segregation ATPase
MAELTRQDLQEVFKESLEPFAKAVQEDFQQVNRRLEAMEQRLGGVEQRIDGVEQRLGGVEQRLDGVEQRLGAVEADVKWMKENSGELFAKLDRFIALLEKHDHELVLLAQQVKRLEERLSKLEAAQK